MPRLPLIFPKNGVSHEPAYSKQPVTTTEIGENVCDIDYVTGRSRGAQRPGLVKHATALVSSEKIAELALAIFDSKRTQYRIPGVAAATGISTPVTDPAAARTDLLASRRNTTATDARNGTTDRQGNLYVLDGNAGCIKFNSELRRVAKIAFPVEDEDHVVRAIHVDDFDGLYAAVSEGGDGRKARMWKFQLLPSGEYELYWQITTEAYVERIQRREGLLYTVQNREDVAVSAVVTYDDVDSTDPIVVGTNFAPYPVNSMDVRKSDAAIAVCSLANADRGLDPKDTSLAPKLITWDPSQLANYEKSIWCHFDASQLDLENGSLHEEWEDLSGNSRNLFWDPAAAPGTSAPRFVKDAVGSLPAVRFRSAEKSFLRSDRNVTYTESEGNAQRSTLPQWDEAKWTAFFLVRISPGTAQSFLWGHGGSAFTRRIEFNYGDSTNAGALAVRQGDLQYIDGSAAGADSAHGAAFGGVPNNVPNTAKFGDTAGEVFEDTEYALITIQHNGFTAPTRSYLRINGVPYDEYTSADIGFGSSITAVHFGLAPTGPAIYGDFDLLEHIVFRDVGGVNLTIPSYPYTTDPGFSGTGAAPSDTEVEQVEGQIAGKWGLSHILSDANSTGAGAPPPVNSWNGEGITGPFVHPYRKEFGPPDGEDRTAAAWENVTWNMLTNTSAMVAKLNPSTGKAQWVVASDGTTFYGGVGWDCKWGTRQSEVSSAAPWVQEGYLFSYGPPDAANDNFDVRRISDEGDQFTIGAPGGSWKHLTGITQTYAHPKMAVDEFDNLYVPIAEAVPTKSVIAFVRETHISGAGTPGNPIVDFLLDSGNGQPAYAVAVPRVAPNYEDELNADGATPELLATRRRAEHVYALTSNEGNTAFDTIHKVRLVRAAPLDGSSRATQLLAVSDGSLWHVRGGNADIVNGGGSIFLHERDEGATVVEAQSQYIETVSAFQRVFITDGINYWTYDPKKSGTVATAGTVEKYTATTAGEIPDRCKIMSLWRGRIVLARDSDDPNNWHMSAYRDPFDWDRFPSIADLATQAVSGNDSRVGPAPDIVQGWMPWDDDTAIVLGGQSMHILRGDPLAGGEFDLLTSSVGGAFGRAWALDGKHTGYILSNEGDVFRLTRRGGLRPLTEDRISRTLRDIDYGSFYCRMAWDMPRDGLHVMLFPFKAPAAVEHYFWSKRNDAWWTWTYANDNVRPTSLLVFDGDQAVDRKVLVGGGDGYIRRIDNDAANDDGAAIGSRVRIGPLTHPKLRDAIRFTGVDVVLASDRDGCEASLFVSDEPDNAGDPVWSGHLNSGRNRKLPLRGRGQYLWVELADASLGSWALESMEVELYPAGRVRAL